MCLMAYGLDNSTRDNVRSCRVLAEYLTLQLYLGIILWVVVIATAIFAFMQEAKSASVMAGILVKFFQHSLRKVSKSWHPRNVKYAVVGVLSRWMLFG